MPIMQHSRIRLALRKHWPILLIMVAFALLCTAYGATVPLGETPDELAHYPYVRYSGIPCCTQRTSRSPGMAPA